MEESLLEEWQERLGLSDWAIALRYNCEQEYLQDQEAVGETEWQVTIKSAYIKIVSKEVYGDRMTDFDFEEALVHELLHLKFSLIDLDSSTYEANVAEHVRHQLIDDLARALVLAKRGETKRKLSSTTPKAEDFKHSVDRIKSEDNKQYETVSIPTMTTNLEYYRPPYSELCTQVINK